ncbi:hypothetical protein COL940_010941 [Colletotrichum noveboracense]|nr:hypothetical protein COL940_010941 [Colletotrichum noveboracense]
MSSRASVKSPTPRSSYTSRKQAPKSLDEDDTEELKQQLNKTNKDFKEMRDIFNQNTTALKELQEQARKTQELEKEVNTLRAAANVISAPVEG